MYFYSPPYYPLYQHVLFHPDVLLNLRSLKGFCEGLCPKIFRHSDKSQLLFSLCDTILMTLQSSDTIFVCFSCSPGCVNLLHRHCLDCAFLNDVTFMIVFISSPKTEVSIALQLPLFLSSLAKMIMLSNSLHLNCLFNLKIKIKREFYTNLPAKQINLIIYDWFFCFLFLKVEGWGEGHGRYPVSLF